MQTIWITGLSGAGKTTLARALQARLQAEGQMVLMLDGDEMRHGLNRDLGFSDEDRSENIRRAACVAALANRSGIAVIAAFITPLASQRTLAREIVGNTFFEVYLNTDFDVCAARDVKGLYAKAASGLIKQFTGLSAPFEASVTADLTIDTGVVSKDIAVDQLLAALAQHE